MYEYSATEGVACLPKTVRVNLGSEFTVPVDVTSIDCNIPHDSLPTTSKLNEPISPVSGSE